MLRASLAIFLFLFSSPCAFAESSVWKLENTKQHFYIAGSIHLLRKTDYPLPKEFEYAYGASDKVIFETSLDDSMQTAMQEMIVKKGLFPEGETLDKHLSVDTYQQLKTYCEDNRIPLAKLNHMKPWLISLTLTVLELMHHDINPSDGIDIHFHQRAIADNKATGGLVPVQEHVDIISAFGDELNDELIINELNEIPTVAAMMDELITAWRSGDHATLDQWLIQKMRDTSPNIYKKVISDRNKHWLSITEKHIKSKENILIIVGVGHLVGKDSLIQHLKDKGYKFSQLKVET